MSVIGRHQAAVGHAVGADFDDQAAVGETLQHGLVARVACDAVVDERLGGAGTERALLGVAAQDFVEADADAGEVGRQIENVAELPVPADQLKVLVEHRDALAHVIERLLQDFAVVVDRGAGVVEQLERRLGRNRPLAQQQREHEARRRGADRRGEQVLGVAHQLEVGLVLRIEADAARRGKALER